MLLAKKTLFIAYNTMDSLMKWAKKAERTMQSRVEADDCPVYFCYDLDMWKMKRIRGRMERDGKGTVYCFDY